MNDDNKYLQKMILFTEENYAGDALVLLRAENPDKNISAYKRIYLNNIKYVSSGMKDYTSFSGVANSLIVDKGDWCVSADEVSTYSVYPGDAFTKLSDKEGFYPIKSVVVSRSYDGSSPVVVEKSNLQLLENISSPGNKYYEFTFFPLENAFIISPAPAGVRDDNTKNFRWEIFHGDEFSIKSYAQGKAITETRLVFKTHEVNSGRPTPITKWINGNWIAPETNVVDIQDGDRFRFEQVHDGAKWGFNFTCKADGMDHEVDPEVQVGAGTRR